jgi:hypothetical protein
MFIFESPLLILLRDSVNPNSGMRAETAEELSPRI